MDQEAVAKELETFIRAKYEVRDDDRDFDRDVHLFDYGYVDSFGAVALTSFVETTFGIKITDADLVIRPLNTINEISGFVVKRRKGEV
jgi:D-alanine--poly(phosphoribitol) ligase subunit 2